MRYKDYVWPHNPRVYTIEYKRTMGARKVPFGRYHLQDLGPAQRVMRGEGEFVGEGAYGEFKKLATVFYAGGPGLLVHPVWQTSNAYFVELSLTQEPRADYVRYHFTFWESYDGHSTGTKVTINGNGGGQQESAPAQEQPAELAAQSETLPEAQPEVREPETVQMPTVTTAPVTKPLPSPSDEDWLTFE